MALATSTTDIRVTWQRPIASGTIEDTLSYSISINNNFLQLLNDATTMHLITNLDPGTDYTIQVCVYVFLYVCEYVLMCSIVCLCMFLYLLICVCVCVCVCVSVSVCVCVSVSVCGWVGG